MKFTFPKNTLLKLAVLMACICFSCGNNNATNSLAESATLENEDKDTKIVTVGADQYKKYVPLLKGKKVGVIGNQTSIVSDKKHPYKGNEKSTITKRHLVDFLVGKNVNIVKVFAPEHGFRGKADAGELVQDGIDTKTGLPIVSLYGKNKKPSPEQMDGLEIMVFDIQDVGARFYTYISTLHYVMEACAEAGIPLLVLDRPNPNGHYVDGPVLEPQHTSFVGMHPVPIVYGMTIGEYAQMINGEGWLNDKIQCDLTVIPIGNYTHDTQYSLPVKPSPNLPNDVSINLYPSLCFFEGTVISAGRGTDTQFQIFGAPQLPEKDFGYSFTPQANEGAKYPKFKGEQCFGRNLQESPRLDQINLKWLIEAYQAYPDTSKFFNNFLVKLAGTEKLQQQIEAGMSSEAIRSSWKEDLRNFQKIRKQYLLYE